VAARGGLPPQQSALNVGVKHIGVRQYLLNMGRRMKSDNRINDEGKVLRGKAGIIAHNYPTIG